MSIPVILDTDIGMDVDDVWALAFLMCCPELDLKLVVSENGDTEYAAALAAKLLTIAERDDVPVGVGIPLTSTPRTHLPWLADFTLADYVGAVHRDGVGAMIDQINASPEPVTIVAIGPVTNLAAALQRDPSIADKVRFVGMHGSVRKGYLGAPKPHLEYNVKAYPQACRMVFEAAWPMTITPLDTCGTVMIRGDAFEALLQSDKPLVRAVMDNHRIWTGTFGEKLYKQVDLTRQSSLLFDTVAVYLAFAEDLLKMEDLGLRVADDGATVIDDSAKSIRCAMEWNDQQAFEALLVERLLGY
ncbi:MAG: nucleoside hydrolase [Proteobacteria bacterium]|nr:nucleoside hydrolase [Pseudomonadota bacterium]